MKETMEDVERERALREHYESAIAQVTRMAHIADTKASQALRDSALVKQQLVQEQAHATAAEQEKIILRQELADAKDDLNSMRKQYDGQLDALTEYSAGLKDKVSTYDVELTNIRGCQVQCATCKGWNTIQYLLSPNGAGGKVCQHGPHPTCSFKR